MTLMMTLAHAWWLGLYIYTHMKWSYVKWKWKKGEKKRIKRKKGERERRERKRKRKGKKRRKEKNRNRKFIANIQRDLSPLQILLVCSSINKVRESEVKLLYINLDKLMGFILIF